MGGLAVLDGSEVTVVAELFVLLLLKAREVSLFLASALLLAEHLGVGSALVSLGYEFVHGHSS